MLSSSSSSSSSPAGCISPLFLGCHSCRLENDCPSRPSQIPILWTSPPPLPLRLQLWISSFVGRVSGISSVLSQARSLDLGSATCLFLLSAAVLVLSLVVFLVPIPSLVPGPGLFQPLFLVAFLAPAAAVSPSALGLSHRAPPHALGPVFYALDWLVFVVSHYPGLVAPAHLPKATAICCVCRLFLHQRCSPLSLFVILFSAVGLFWTIRRVRCGCDCGAHVVCRCRSS